MTMTATFPFPPRIQLLCLLNKNNLPPGDQDSADDDTEIYWLRPKPRSPKCSPSDSDRLNWFNKKLNPSQKHKVTFDDAVVR